MLKDARFGRGNAISRFLKRSACKGQVDINEMNDISSLFAMKTGSVNSRGTVVARISVSKCHSKQEYRYESGAS